MTETRFEPTLYQKIRTTTDRNGNSRVVYVVMNCGGAVLDVIDAYYGKPAWFAQMTQLPEYTISPSDFRDLRRMEAADYSR